MKKKLLPLAMLAGLAGAAGTAQASYINSDGLGQVLIYPYYTAEGDNFTTLHVVNTTNEVKAIKVRFLEGENSQEVLDFNLYLSAWDEWTGAVVLADPVDGLDLEGEFSEDELTGAKLITFDNSCTAPAIPEDGATFRNFAYAWMEDPDNPANSIESGDTNKGLNRTREGYIELIEMGVLGSDDGDTVTEYDLGADGQFGAAAAATHNDSGVPANCDLLRNAWLSTGQWTSDQNNNIDIPTGGLYGYAGIINVNEGTNATYSAVAVGDFQDTVQNTSTGSLSPSLTSGVSYSDVFDSSLFPPVASESFSDSLDAISSIFMRDTLSNDYVVLDEGTETDTDWVVTFPTKRFYVQEELLEDRQPFSDEWDGSTACEHIDVEYWNREELYPTAPPSNEEIDFSPRPPQFETTPDGFNFCTEVAIMTFNGSSALNSSNRLTYNLNLEDDFLEGWARIDLTTAIPPGGDPADYNERTITGVDVGYIYSGLPVVGFAVQKYENDQLEVDDQMVLANYAGVIEHKFTRDIVESGF